MNYEYVLGYKLEPNKSFHGSERNGGLGPCIKGHHPMKGKQKCIVKYVILSYYS